MKIQSTTSVAGNGWSLYPGEIKDMDNLIAADLIAAGHAVSLEEAQVLEKASIELPTEKATLPRRKAKQ